MIRENMHSAHRRPKSINPNSYPAHVGRTLYPNTVTLPGGPQPILKPGKYSTKLGAIVEKGAWREMPIFSLTLEERATCPRSCAAWLTCYGNNMNLAVRYIHGEWLEENLIEELHTLSKKSPKGFVIRLHVLGDFYNFGYVQFWYDQLTAHPALHIFGYTAWPQDSVIGLGLIDIRRAYPKRFKVRFSGVETIIVKNESDAPLDSVVCPAQTGKTRSCATCALCWGSDKKIAFLEH